MSAFPWTDAAVRRALGLDREPVRADLAYAGISTDSRTVGQGDLYVALVGEHHDGHRFVAEALAKGAHGAVVSRPVTVEASAPLYRVADTLVALGMLAAHRRASIQAPVVGITGSAGKTTTKELTRGALAAALRVHATRANLNNRVGMPMTLLATPDDAQAVVLEMGTNQPGEIAALARVARPDVGVVTTVGEAHLEKLGSLEGVLREKLDLLRNLAAGGRAVVGDEPEFLPGAARAVCASRRVIHVAGWSARADESLRPSDVEVDAAGAYRFRWRGQQVRLAVPGRHAVVDALLALTVAELLGVADDAAVAGLAEVGAGSLRGEIRRLGDLTVVVDCYNANPPSVRAALHLLDAQQSVRKVAVLGTMLELGPESPSLHSRSLGYALSLGIDLIVATGAFAQAAADVRDPRVVAVEDWRSAYPALRDGLTGNEVVLLKASRGVALEGMLPLLEADFATSRVGEA